VPEIPIAALNHFDFCPYRCYLMFVVCEFEDNAYTLEGTRLHQRSDTPGQSQRGEITQFRSIWLSSETYGLYGRADVIEMKNDQIYPVEHKRGKKGDWRNDQLQLCAQALCLEEMLKIRIPTAYLYYAESHQREEVSLDSALRDYTIQTIENVRALLVDSRPPAAIYGKRCKGCSLYNSCLPREMMRAREYVLKEEDQ